MTMMDQNQQVQYYQQHLNQNSGQTQLVIHQNELDAYHQQAGTNQVCLRNIKIVSQNLCIISYSDLIATDTIYSNSK